MDEMRDGPVVVGFDPSPAAAQAMDVAAREAEQNPRIGLADALHDDKSDPARESGIARD